MVSHWAHQRYIKFSRGRQSWEHRITPLGQIFAGALLLCTLPALNTRFTLAYQLVSFLSALGLVSAAGAWLTRQKFSVTRHIKGTATAEDPFDYEIRIDKKNDMESCADPNLFIKETFPISHPSYEAWLNSNDDPKMNLFDRWTGYRKFESYTREHRAKQLTCEPQHQGHYRLTVIFPHRGLMELSTLNIYRPEPLGLMHSVSRCHSQNQILVLPRQVSLPDMTLPSAAGQRIQPEAMHHRVGQQGDFHSLREYRYGDSKKFIHWKSSAKTGSLKVMEMEEESSSRTALILDTRAQDEKSFEVAVSIAASFLRDGVQSESKLDLMFVGHENDSISVGRELGGDLPAQRALALVRPQRDGSGWLGLETKVMSKIDQLTSCVLVCCEWHDEQKQWLQRMIYQGLPVVIIHVADNQEQDLVALQAHPERWIHVSPDHPERDLLRLSKV
jgi:uncharacterized protein (DUF58 family)